MRMGDLSKPFRLQADISSCKSILFSKSDDYESSALETELQIQFVWKDKEQYCPLIVGLRTFSYWGTDRDYHLCLNRTGCYSACGSFGQGGGMSARRVGG